MSPESIELLSRAYYIASVDDFLSAIPETVLGTLTANSEFSVETSQRDAWQEEIRILREVLPGLAGTLYIEFNIPRMGHRIDAVLVCGPVVFVIEFKTGESVYSREGLNQVWDYALDLKNFHETSHNASIVPILVVSEALVAEPELRVPYEDKVFPPVVTSPRRLRSLIDRCLSGIVGDRLDDKGWGSGLYRPTPTIIEAAQALYAQHSVDAIACYDAGKRNLKVTSQRVEEIVDEARRAGRKAICFVTGVPGAGKTLVGLNVATKRRDSKEPTHAVFLSGNGPLVAVLHEALTRDEVARRRAQGERVLKGTVLKSVKAFIQNVHHFRDEALRESGAPIDHVVIFDEAQRAWNLKQTASFMRTKKKLLDFASSEPEFLISYMNRHQDWTVIVCLVGGGQEINVGEAGIGAWIDAIQKTFLNWDVYISSELKDSEYAAGKALEAIRSRSNVFPEENLHLAVSIRSFRAENVSSFVKALLDLDVEGARDHYSKLSGKYPIVLTRDLNRARAWVREHARGNERCGLVASSKALRLKPHAIDMRVSVNPVHWFLNDRHDTRSSYYLEDAASEFKVQGLEVDWVCLTWDGDLRFKKGGWGYHSFSGKSWKRIHKEDNQDHLRNAYRVLLTRARQGMVIFVPPGAKDDPTRRSEIYDPTFRYLTSLGIPVLDPQ